MGGIFQGVVSKRIKGARQKQEQLRYLAFRSRSVVMRISM